MSLYRRIRQATDHVDSSGHIAFVLSAGRDDFPARDPNEAFDKLFYELCRSVRDESAVGDPGEDRVVGGRALAAVVAWNAAITEAKRRGARPRTGEPQSGLAALDALSATVLGNLGTRAVKAVKTAPVAGPPHRGAVKRAQQVGKQAIKTEIWNPRRDRCYVSPVACCSQTDYGRDGERVDENEDRIISDLDQKHAKAKLPG